MHRLVVALVTLIGLTGATFLAAYLLLFSATTDRAAALAPADTAFYANIYLQPSAGQQMNLGGLIGRLPGFADEASLDDKVDQVVANLLTSAGLDVDYEAEVKPWLGNQVALAGWAGEPDPVIVAIVDVKDVEAARAALADLSERTGTSADTTDYRGVEISVAADSAYAFVDELLVIGATTAPIEAVVDVNAGAEALAGRDDFRATMADLPADHLASMFVDLAAIGAGDGHRPAARRSEHCRRCTGRRARRPATQRQRAVRRHRRRFIGHGRLRTRR